MTHGKTHGKAHLKKQKNGKAKLQPCCARQTARPQLNPFRPGRAWKNAGYAAEPGVIQLAF